MKNLQKIQKTTTILLFGMIMFCLKTANAQWSKIPSIYGGKFANDGAVSFSCNGKGYVCAGSASDNIYEYDTSSKQWRIKDAVPKEMGHAFSMVFVVNDIAYIVGGDTAGHPVTTVWQFSPLNKGSFWARMKDFPAGVRDGGVGFSIGNTGYISCGFDGANIYNDLWKYDVSKDTWTKDTAHVPNYDGLLFASAFVAKGKAYIVGGAYPPTAAVETQQVTEFDPATDKMTVKAPFGGTARQAAFAFSNGGYGYIGGGQTGYTTVFHDMWRYDASGNSWTKVEKSPLASPAWSSAFVIGNNAYVGIGSTFSGSSLTGVDSFYKYKMIHDNASVLNVEEQKISCSLFPNPAKDKVSISGDFDRDFSVNVYDIAGKLVLSQKNSKILDVKRLTNGIYTIRIESKDQVSSRQFLKE